MTLIICKRIDCIYIFQRADKKYQCKCDAIGIGQDKKCDTYMQMPDEMKTRKIETVQHVTIR